jgi:FlaA1/EpsC-like NDP-sugar epimerase
VVGLLDDDPTRHALRVQGVQVLGDLDALPRLAAEYEVDEVIVPRQGTTRSDRRSIAERCAEIGVACKHFAFHLAPAGDDTALPSPAGDGLRPAPRS